METKQYELPMTFATNWILALRSGKYKQTKTCLSDSKGYCCLGVACIISGLEHGDIRMGGDLGDVMDSIPKDSELIKLADNRDLQNIFMNLNDNDNKSFPEIADWIEENVNLI